jgi:hypothetical protein
MSQEDLHAECARDPLRFWRDAAAAVDWLAPPSLDVLNGSQAPLYSWFKGAVRCLLALLLLYMLVSYL